jgi:hypothetical protein
MVEYIPCYSVPAVYWGLLPVTRLARRIKLIAKYQKADRASTLCVQLWYEMYSSCGGGGLRCNVLYRRHPLKFQYPVCAEPLVFLTFVWINHTDSFFPEASVAQSFKLLFVASPTQFRQLVCDLLVNMGWSSGFSSACKFCRGTKNVYTAISV